MNAQIALIVVGEWPFPKMSHFAYIVSDSEMLMYVLCTLLIPLLALKMLVGDNLL